MSTLCDEYGINTSKARQSILLVLSLEDKQRRKEMDIVHIQKVIRYFEFLVERKDIDFTNYNYGLVSSEVYQHIENLLQSDLIDEIDTDKKDNDYALTEQGERCAEEVKQQLTTMELRKMYFAKQELNDLPTNELLFFMYNLIPDSVENSKVWDDLRKYKVELSGKLFIKGRINLNTACKWADLNEKEFLATLPRSN